MASLRQSDGRANTVYNVVNHGGDGIPVLRVTEERSSSALSSFSTQDGGGPPPSLPSWLVRSSLLVLIMSALIIQIIGQRLLFKITEYLGFCLMFGFVFVLICSIYYCWCIFSRKTVGITNNSQIIRTYAILCVSEVISCLSDYVIDLGLLEYFPIDIAFYFVLSMSIFSLFSGLIHRNNLSAMFSQETTSFVVITVITHYSLSCIFKDMLPSFLYSQIVYSSCLLAITLSLLVDRYPRYFTLSSIKRFVRNSLQVARGESIGGSGVGPVLNVGAGGRRFSTASLASNVSSVVPQHRISLTSQSSRGTSVTTNNFDSDTLNEAHGLLGDLLFQEESLTKKGKESLKHIQDLLAPRVTRTAHLASSRSRIGSEDEASDTSSNIGVTPHLYGYRTSKSNRRSVRNPISQFTTTTTATGLPTINQDPVERKRSVAPRDLKSRISVVEGRPSVHQLPPNFRKRVGSVSSPLSRSTSVFAQESESDIDGGGGSTTLVPGSATDDEKAAGQMQKTSPATKRLFSDSDSPSYDSKEDSSPGLQRRRSDGSMLIHRRTGSLLSSYESVPSDVIIEEGNNTSGNADTEDPAATPLALNAPSFPANKVALFNALVLPSTDYSLMEYQHSEIDVLDQVMEWDFPIFDLNEKSGKNILSQMAYCLFLEAGLIDTFKIPQRQFINYFRILEANYGNNAYHNRMHAADVLHATSYLLFEEIPEFSHEISRSSDREWVGHQRRVSGTNIASALSILEVFACYMAAAMHDFDHPGRTNAFLVATKNPLAVLYNDKSVLENHHAAASWDLLTSHGDTNFISDFEESELKRFRFLLIECILATDLKLHFDIVRDFKDKTEDGSAGLDWSSEVDRLQMMKMVIKMADINTASKSYELHRAWTVRITEEFYQQSDEEVKLGLPQTIFMHRNEKEKLPAIQVSFIQNLVAPLFHACAEAGLIPGIIDNGASNGGGGEKEGGSDDDSDSLDSASAVDDSLPLSSSPITRKIISIILTNLEMNYQAWKSEIPPPPPSEEKATPSETGDGETAETVTNNDDHLDDDDDDDHNES